MSILIKDVMLVPMVGQGKVVDKTNILIEGNRITQLGETGEDIEAGTIIDGNNKVAMPGLINGHTHIGMSLLRNYTDDVPLHTWLTEKIWPVEAKLKAEDVYWASLLSMLEMIMSGTTTFSDMYFFMEEVARGVEEAGIRGVLSRGLTEEPAGNEEKLASTKVFFKDWHNQARGRIKVMLAPHAPYTCGPPFLTAIIELAHELDAAIHIHLAETKKEVADSLQLYGKSPIRHVRDLGLFELPTLAAHCIHVDGEDIEILKENRVHPVYNPSSNLKLASGFTPVDQMLKAGINVCLGTDGPSSNNNLNMFEEIHLAALVNKAVNEDAVSIPAETALKMATINGAGALQWAAEIGSIEIGKKADIILIDLDKPHLYPRHNIFSALAYSAQGSDVDTVIIDGKIVMEDREIKTLDREKITYQAERIAQDLIRR